MHNVLSRSRVVRPSVRYQTSKHGILKTNEPIWCQVAQVVHGNVQAWSQQVKSQGHARPKTNLDADASFSTTLGRVGYAVM